MVLVNNSNTYVVLLFGLKAGHFKKLSEHMLQAIRAALLEECIKEKIIAQFLEQSVKHTKGVIYTKTKTRSMVARMNRSCEMVHHFEDLLDDKTITQLLTSNEVCRDFISAGKNKYVYPHEELYKDLETCYEGPIFRAEAVQIKVTLDLDKHHAW